MHISRNPDRFRFRLEIRVDNKHRPVTSSNHFTLSLQFGFDSAKILSTAEYSLVS